MRWAGVLAAALCRAYLFGAAAACATSIAGSIGPPRPWELGAFVAGVDASATRAMWERTPLLSSISSASVHAALVADAALRRAPRPVHKRARSFGAMQMREYGTNPGSTAQMFGRAAAHVLLALVLAAVPPAALIVGQASASSEPVDHAKVLSTTITSASTVKEELEELTSRIERIEQQRADQGPSKEDHADDEFQSLISKMKSKNLETRKVQMVTGSHRAPRAEYSGQGKYRSALRDAGFSLREANRLLILEAWDIVHRGSYGYPGWYDPNGGLYVDPESFYFEDRKEIIRGISEKDLASPAVAHDVIRHMVADLQDPYSRFSESSELTINADDHAIPPAERVPAHAPQTELLRRALDGTTGKRLVGVGLQLADPLDGEEDLVVVAPIPNSPAEAAGIQPLDRILAIDDLDVREYRLTTGEATNLLRGWEDTDVRLLVQRARRGDGSIPPGYDAMGDRLPRQRPFADDGEDQGSRGRGQGQGQTVEWGKVEEVSLKRKKLNMPPVLSNVLNAREGGRKIGYLRINYFSRAGTDALAQAVAEMEAQGVSGYIIDVRNCRGGLLKEALVTSSMFQEEVPGVEDNDGASNIVIATPASQQCRVSTGCISSFGGEATGESRKNGSWKGPKSLTLLNIMDASGLVRTETLSDQRDLDRWPTSGGYPIASPVPRGKPIQVLTNRGSASAAEVLVMSLAGNGRAHIIGERTFGKALIQHPYRLADGSILTLTVAEYLSPGLQHLGKGLLPQSACTSSPQPPVASQPATAPDSCILAAETRISTTLARWEKAGEVRGNVASLAAAKDATGNGLIGGKGGKGGLGGNGGQRERRSQSVAEKGKASNPNALLGDASPSRSGSGGTRRRVRHSVPGHLVHCCLELSCISLPLWGGGVFDDKSRRGMTRVGLELLCICLILPCCSTLKCAQRARE
jgi:C-terminal processing protease CtpA/Prc/uncharacterized protein (UPF0335 family)